MSKRQGFRERWLNIEGWRLRFALWYNQYRSEVCWKELLEWVDGKRWGDMQPQACRPNNPGTPYAFCGKCARYFEEVKLCRK